MHSDIWTPGTPLLTSPYGSAIVELILDSQSKYRSEAAHPDSPDNSCDSLDVPSTPELSPDLARETYIVKRSSDITPPSPTPQPRAPSARPAYQPRPLMLVEKHLSVSEIPLSAIRASLAPIARAPSPAAAPLAAAPLAIVTNTVAAAAAPPVAKSTKGWKPRVAGAPTAQPHLQPSVKSLTPGKRVRAAANKRTIAVYTDDATSSLANAITAPASIPAGRGRAQDGKTNSFLGARKLSTRRRDAFTAARRKLEGVGQPDEQTDRSSGTSSGTEECENGLLEARGSAVE